jgi:hypothetical protein
MRLNDAKHHLFDNLDDDKKNEFTEDDLKVERDDNDSDFDFKVKSEPTKYL